VETQINAVIHQIQNTCCRITIYRASLEDRIFQHFLRLLDTIIDMKSQDLEIIDAYHSLAALLLSQNVHQAHTGSASGISLNIDAWQNHLLDLILNSDNAFTRAAETLPSGDLNPSLYSMAANDLACLQQVFKLNAPLILSMVKARLPGSMAGGFPVWSHPLITDHVYFNSESRLRVKQRFIESADWTQLVPVIADYHRQNGSGLYGNFHLFRWSCENGHRQLSPVSDPDPVRLGNLIGYEEQKRTIVENTEQFLAGYPANNLLLYGDRGTGKSSTVKAIANEYAPQGLRLIEVEKRYLADYYDIARMVRGRSQKFILFADDLSFEENEVEYKHLKAILEGGVETRPDNLLVYATSNRRHLVREYFSDNNSGDGESRSADTVEEKLSLADRFGITIVYTSPSRKEYLHIVQELAKQAGLEIDPTELETRALQWEMWQNGASGRTARQFVDHLTGSHKARNKCQYEGAADGSAAID